MGMLRGLMVVNAFLRTAKFETLYSLLMESARKEGMGLNLTTNAALSAVADSRDFHPEEYDFVLFWDKDVALGQLLEQRGLRLFNSSQSVLWCDDKAQTYLKLRQAGVPIPQTILAPKTFHMYGYSDLSFVEEAAHRLGMPLVLKECFGSFGQQVYLPENLPALKQKVQELVGTPLLFQQYIQESHGRDIRINIVGGQVVASILRQSTDGDFRSNLTRGGCMRPYSPTAEETDAALRAVAALGLDFAGVDVLFGKDGPLVCEVNSNAHFKTTLKCTGVNMADAIMAHIKRKLENA